MYATIERARIKSETIKHFFKEMAKQATGLTEDNINFLMTLANSVKQYPKFWFLQVRNLVVLLAVMAAQL